jgi:hypothetical protein
VLATFQAAAVARATRTTDADGTVHLRGGAAPARVRLM